MGDVGRPAEAIPLYQQALRLKPDFWIAYNNLINGLWGFGREEEAWRLGEEMKRRAGGRPGKGPEILYQNTDNMTGNLLPWRKAIIADMAAHGGVGSGTSQQGPILADNTARLHDAKGAEIYLRTSQGLDTDPNTIAMTHFVHGYIALDQGDYPRAATEMEAFQTDFANPVISTNYPGYNCWIAPAEEMGGHPDKADAVLKAAGSFVDCTRFKGDILDHRGDWAGAQKAYAAAVALAPDLPGGAYSWGRALARHGDLAGAEAKYAEANRHGPNWADPLKAWGDALAAQGRWKEALAKYQAAAKDAPDWAELKSALAAAPSGTATLARHSREPPRGAGAGGARAWMWRSGAWREWLRGLIAAPRGRHALSRLHRPESASQIPVSRWPAILIRTVTAFGTHRSASAAAAVSFFVILAFAPAIAAFGAAYGLFAEPASVARRLEAFEGMVPGGALDMIRGEAMHFAQGSQGRLVATLAIGLIAGLWSAASAVREMIAALNRAFDEEESRGWLTVQTLAVLMAAGITGVSATNIVLMLWATGGRPHDVPGAAIQIALRVGATLVSSIAMLAVLYRYGPDRKAARWRWATPGGLIAGVAGLITSSAASFYLAQFSQYERLYGALGSVLGLMLWLWAGLIVVLFGAELNHQLEREAEVLSAPAHGTSAPGQG